MSSAPQLVEMVKANGGRLWIEDGWLIVEPRQAGLPIVQELRAHKPEIVALLQGRCDSELDQDPAAWKEDFDKWKAESCIQREGPDDSTTVSALWVDFSEWTVAQESAPCMRPTFERLLTDAGHWVADGMASGLLLAKLLPPEMLLKMLKRDHVRPHVG